MTLSRRLRLLSVATAVALAVGSGSAAVAATEPLPSPSQSDLDDHGDHDEHGPTAPLSIEPWDDGATPSTPSRARALAPVPTWHLPFDAGQSWSSGGPHRDSDGTAWGALDFSPGGSTNKRVVAIADGRVYRVTCPNGWFLGVDHGGGWKSEYYHLSGAQESLIGRNVPAGTFLGTAASTLPCGGSSNGPHVHLSILYGDAPTPGPGVQRPYYPVDGMRFGNYVVYAGATVHSGRWTTTAGALVFSNWGCCLTSTTPTARHFSQTPAPTISGSPASGATLTAATPAWTPAATLTYQWFRDGSAIAGATSSTYTVAKVDRGAALTVAATGRLVGYVEAVATSGAVRIATPVDRVSGLDRYETAARISATAFAPGVSEVYVVGGQDFPDAMGASAAAGARAAPVLITARDGVPTATAVELARLRPQRIVVVGGPATVSDAVARALASAGGVPVERVSGIDRYETAAAVSRTTYPQGAGTVFLASGLVFSDALSAAPIAGAQGAPVLLTQPDGLPTATADELRRLAPARVVIVGGPASVTERTKSEVATTVADVVRISGADRYETSAALSAVYAPVGTTRAFVASGVVFPDALAGAPVAAMTGSPVILTYPGALHAATTSEMTRLAPARITVFGGPASVTESVARALAPLAR